jgi:hypothetical protein
LQAAFSIESPPPSFSRPDGGFLHVAAGAAVGSPELTLPSSREYCIVTIAISRIQGMMTAAWEGTTMAVSDTHSELTDAQHSAELRKAVIAATVGTTIEW